MGAYNRYEETYCCENKKLLTDILRNEWKFDGFVMSDFVWGVYDAEHSLRAGLDIEMMFTMRYTKGKIKKCLKKGRLNIEHIDRAVKNILSVLIRQIPIIKPRNMSGVNSMEHRALALEIAEKGMVLLENNGVLPLASKEKVLISGSYADTENVGDWGSSRVYSKNVSTPYAGLKAHMQNVAVVNGNDILASKEAVINITSVILCVGSNRKEEGEYFANTNYKLTEKPKDGGGDRASLRLNKEEVALIKAMKEAGKKVIVVLYSGAAIIVEEWKQYADAIVMNYYSGEQGGNALANLLLGKKNFGGHLPFTIAKTEEDYPSIIGIGDKPYVMDYGYYHGYTLLDKENKQPAYPFGYGLSYTTFEVGNIEIKQQADSILVKTAVRNTGNCAGADVVQVYFGSNKAMDGEDRPVKLLKGFKRVELLPGEIKVVEIIVNKEELKFWSKGTWILDSSYTVYLGDDSLKAMSNAQSIIIE
jgi:beta-glucosidase